ncbi:MAG: response regulator [Magnetospiraceae bacterium]
MAPDSPHILVVDDDKRLRKLLLRYLSDNGFTVTTAQDSAEAEARMAGVAFDLIVLDVMMPGETGLEFTSRLRTLSNVPILLLTAMGAAESRIDGLERGADDYLAKPFEPRELVLRINAILRRLPTPPQEVSVRLGTVMFDPERLELRRGDALITLTTMEAGLLAALCKRQGEALTREELSGMADEALGERTIDVQVTRLRRKIEPDPKNPRYLRTVRGVGYQLVPD